MMTTEIKEFATIIFAIILYFISIFFTGCKTFKDPNTQLDAIQYSCVLGTNETKSEVVADLCKIAPSLLEIVKKVIAGKEIASKSSSDQQGIDASCEGLK